MERAAGGLGLDTILQFFTEFAKALISQTVSLQILKSQTGETTCDVQHFALFIEQTTHLSAYGLRSVVAHSVILPFETPKNCPVLLTRRMGAFSLAEGS
jgi:hypothetical protein